MGSVSLVVFAACAPQPTARVDADAEQTKKWFESEDRFWRKVKEHADNPKENWKLPGHFVEIMREHLRPMKPIEWWMAAGCIGILVFSTTALVLDELGVVWSPGKALFNGDGASRS
jgi:hypothetical protein